MSRVLARPLDTRTIALSVAGVLAVGTGVLTFNYLASVGHANAPAQRRMVLIAAKPIPSHAMITADMISRVTRPADTVDPDALLTPTAAVGTIAVNDIPAGSLLTGSKVVRTSAVDLPGRVHPGMRAISISLDRVKGVSNLLEAGDRVDVIAVIPPRGDAGPKSATIIRDVRVLSIGQNTDATPGATPSPDTQQYTTATLEVTPKQADLIALADIGSTLRLALRPPKEPMRSQPVEKLTFSSMASAPRPASAPAPQMMPPYAMQRPAPPPVAPSTPKPKPISPVMMIDGDKVIAPGSGG
jgi:pilus assembly protein CpaB